ncbi:MAG: type III pantothenate kinase [Oscillospiraceae bacterium]|nr:type III pantothenate kinase [Oscillospiraceae bacterium]MCI9363739.1 type III pantothenate kinase [Oscillospiraceae bacterium]RKJ54882.1 type III pantothenate kinase [bacterium 1XD42-8]RKJ63838.1 type III pantothenate kinase [bacterium 1XD42-1]
MAILAIDIGNTSVLVGCLEGEWIRFTSHFAADPNKTDDEYAMMLMGMLSLHQIHPAEIEGSIIASVVPVLRHMFSHALKKILGKTPLVVGSGLRTGLNIRIDNPAQLGSNLVVDAVAACQRYPKPILIFDMGAATTLSVIDKEGSYIGGMIMPGLRLSVDALSSRASHLPNISFDEPEQLIGTNTINCMQAGAIYGHAAMLDGVADRAESALGCPCTAVITGSLAPSVIPYCKREIIYDETLVLRGLRILYEKNRTGRPAGMGGGNSNSSDG